MTKEFEIDEILNAVDNISKIERRKYKTVVTKNDSADKRRCFNSKQTSKIK